ncbi:MAG: beta-glucosidase BglX [Lachnospiraceae bacterium]|nr:beta-glucosidase BglX [Lachnospiraceae bacterium]
MTEQQLVDLLKDMTLEEKLGQLTQLDGSCFSGDGPVTGPEQELGIPSEKFPLAGSILSVTGADRIEQIRRICIEAQPHHIPPIFMADVINGYQTILPIPLALGCTFEEEAAKKTGDIMSREAAADGLHITFAPMVDLVKDARWGRVMESTGESACLNSRMAAAMVEGIQGTKENLDGHLGACTKHFAAYGAPTAGKEYNTVELSERSLREEYLQAYQAAVDAGSAMMMTSFNTLDRIPATGNEKVMRGILRDEMGFEGVLISDWNAIGELVFHHVAVDKKEAARQAITAGVDMDMMSGCYMSRMEELIRVGTVKEELVDESVLRILRLKNRLGLFERPNRVEKQPEFGKELLSEESRKAAREIAAKTMVLLKNEESFLPLDREEDIAFIGPYMEEKGILGAWSFFGDREKSVTVLEGIRSKNPSAQAKKGCGILNPGQTIYGFRFHETNEMTEEETAQSIQEAAEYAAAHKKVVLALGESALQTGEGGSRADITIPDVQKKLLDAVYAANSNLAVIVFAGRPLDIRNIREKAKSILYVWMPGTEGGNAIADILYGDSVPEGKLSMSLPYCVGQCPVFHNELWTGRHAEDGVAVENRFQSKYQDIPNAPLYPFGYGLSYTDFSYSAVELSRSQLKRGERLEAAVTVENTGRTAGAEVVQLYLTDECASVARPVRELKDYQKIHLQPGEKKRVVFTIEEDMLRFYDRDMNYVAEPGAFTVFIGTDSANDNAAVFWLEE